MSVTFEEWWGRRYEIHRQATGSDLANLKKHQGIAWGAAVELEREAIIKQIQTDWPEGDEENVAAQVIALIRARGGR